MPRLALIISVLFCVLPLQASWFKNLDEAKAKAAEEKKDIYLIFTSLKVSGACVQLEKRVLSKKAFQEAVAERFVLVHLDIPLQTTPGMTSPLAGNREVAKKFGVEAYPSAFYLNFKGQTYASESGALIGGPDEYAARLLKKAGEREGQKKALKLAYKKEGLDRARAIIAVLKKVPRGADDVLFVEEMAELARADPEDSLGFQKPRLAEKGFRDLEQALKKVFHKDSYHEVVKLVNAYVLEFQPKGPLLQKALFPKLAALNHGGQTEAAIKAAQEVIAVDPGSAYGKFAAQILAKLQAK